MSIKKLALPAALALCFAFWLGDEVQAQETAEEESNWEVHLNALWLKHYFKPELTELSVVRAYPWLLVKKNYVNDKGNMRAVRLQLYPYLLRAQDKGSAKSGPPVVNITFIPGYEWQKYWKKSIVYLGTELPFKYSYAKRGITFFDVNGAPLVDEDKDRYIIVGLNVLAGIKYPLARNAAISLESTLHYEYIDILEQNILNGRVRNERKAFSSEFNLTPFSAILFSYSF